MVRNTKRSALLTRASILDAGEQRFLERRFQSATLDAVAKSAAVTRGAMCWHFGRKSDLLRAIFERLQAGLREDLHTLMGLRYGLPMRHRSGTDAARPSRYRGESAHQLEPVPGIGTAW
ncbi:TetR family transcriptional regulator [Burkholderia sp. A9]|uniref:TetR family transcriptional regulator n=1 Tax=Burkholderia sp. A9 TaxID=1365108 RepID=UPI000694EB39|nr:TetR family transcriptional regulator [Burkholderia sp. A9]